MSKAEQPEQDGREHVNRTGEDVEVDEAAFSLGPEGGMDRIEVPEGFQDELQYAVEQGRYEYANILLYSFFEEYLENMVAVGGTEDHREQLEEGRYIRLAAPHGDDKVHDEDIDLPGPIQDFIERLDANRNDWVHGRLIYTLDENTRTRAARMLAALDRLEEDVGRPREEIVVDLLAGDPDEETATAIDHLDAGAEVKEHLRQPDEVDKQILEYGEEEVLSTLEDRTETVDIAREGYAIFRDIAADVADEEPDFTTLADDDTTSLEDAGVDRDYLSHRARELRKEGNTITYSILMTTLYEHLLTDAVEWIGERVEDDVFKITSINDQRHEEAAIASYFGFLNEEAAERINRLYSSRDAHAHTLNEEERPPLSDRECDALLDEYQDLEERYQTLEDDGMGEITTEGGEPEPGAETKADELREQIEETKEKLMEGERVNEEEIYSVANSVLNYRLAREGPGDPETDIDPFIPELSSRYRERRFKLKRNIGYNVDTDKQNLYGGLKPEKKDEWRHTLDKLETLLRD